MSMFASTICVNDLHQRFEHFHLSLCCVYWNLECWKSELMLQMYRAILRKCTVRSMFFIILLSVFADVNAQSCKLFIENPEFRNKKVNLSVVTEFTTDSLTFCALQCTDDSCTCFGFNNLTTTCRVQRECDPAVMTDDTGWKYYSVNVTSKLGFFL